MNVIAEIKCITTYLQEKQRGRMERVRKGGGDRKGGAQKAKERRGMVRKKSGDQNERGRDVFAVYAVWFSACFCGDFMALLVILDARQWQRRGGRGS